MDWQPIETAPKDGRPIDLYMPKYSTYTTAHWQESELFAAGWVHESGWRPGNAEEYKLKSLYSHWREHDETAPEGMQHRKWDANKREFVYGKQAASHAKQGEE